VAELQTTAADKLYADGKTDEARAAIQDVVSYTEKAGDAATQSGKKLKDAEISVRKIAHKLADIKRTVDFENQAPLQDAIDHLERIRTQLLAKMFDLGKGSQ
jgi:protein-arginine kinase activator protein McsA